MTVRPLATNPGRLARALVRRVQMLRHRGDAVLCPVCGHHFSRFKDDWNRPDALCWRCGSHERHRAQWLLFERRADLLGRAGSLLHFAPEWSLRQRFARIESLRYVTCDLDAPDVELRIDITDIDLSAASFDGVLCSHVLEHVGDDARAMRELRRITAPDGWCLVMVPLDLELRQSYEDPTIIAPADRERAFWQHDHVRLYGADVGDRLAAAGFLVERIAPEHEFGPKLVRRCRINAADHMWLCRPDRAS